MVSADPVAVDTRNRAPVFTRTRMEETPLARRTSSAMREVAENTKADNVGNAVTAEDPDPNGGPADLHAERRRCGPVRCSGDAGYGQIEVDRSGTKLDYETKDHLHGDGHGHGLLQRFRLHRRDHHGHGCGRAAGCEWR